MDEKECREEAIKRYENGEFPKSVYQDLGRSKSWFFKWLRRYRNEGGDCFALLAMTYFLIPHIQRALPIYRAITTGYF